MEGSPNAPLRTVRATVVFTPDSPTTPRGLSAFWNSSCGTGGPFVHNLLSDVEVENFSFAATSPLSSEHTTLASLRVNGGVGPGCSPFRVITREAIEDAPVGEPAAARRLCLLSWRHMNIAAHVCWSKRIGEEVRRTPRPPWTFVNTERGKAAASASAADRHRNALQLWCTRETAGGRQEGGEMGGKKSGASSAAGRLPVAESCAVAMEFG